MHNPNKGLCAFACSQKNVNISDTLQKKMKYFWKVTEFS